MSEEVSPTFALQASGTTPKAEADVVSHNVIEGSPDTADQGMSARQAADMQEQRLLAGKYKNVSDLEKGYLESQKKISSMPKQAAMGVEDILGAAQLDGESLAQNWMNDGQLNDDQYEALGRVGYSKQVVDAYFDGQVAKETASRLGQDYYQREAVKLSGGEDEWNGLQKWYIENHTQAQVENMNKKLDKQGEYTDAIKSMLWDFKMQSGQGFTNPLVEGQSMPNTTSGYTDVDEFVAAISKQKAQGRYDAHFLKRVENTPPHITKGVM